MTASPTKVNGVERPAVPVYRDWQPISFDRGATVWEKQADPQAVAPAIEPAGPIVDPRAEAEAEAIRARTEAEKAKVAAEIAAINAKAEADRQRAELAAKKATAKAEAEIALAEAETARVIEQAKAEREAREKAATAEAEAAGNREKSAGSWRTAALSFAIVCGIVALPVQMSAFYSPHALWLLAAPLVLEGGAWVVLRGAAAAVDDHRPHWHYRLIAWSLAFIAAGINLSHGLSHFDPATAMGTAFASLAGPGIWDLHEHGRIRTRDGKLTRAQRRAKRAAERKAEAEKLAAEKAARSEKDAAEKAAKVAAEKLAADRAERFPEVWEHALGLAAARGEIEPSEGTWRQAWFDKNGAEPGEDLDVVRDRQRAVKRMAEATGEAPTSTRSKVTNAQRVSHLPPSPNKRRYSPPTTPGVRRKGDAPKFVNAARKQAAITAKQAVDKPAN